MIKLCVVPNDPVVKPLLPQAESVLSEIPMYRGTSSFYDAYDVGDGGGIGIYFQVDEKVYVIRHYRNAIDHQLIQLFRQGFQNP